MIQPLCRSYEIIIHLQIVLEIALFKSIIQKTFCYNMPFLVGNIHIYPHTLYIYIFQIRILVYIANELINSVISSFNKGSHFSFYSIEPLFSWIYKYPFTYFWKNLISYFVTDNVNKPLWMLMILENKYDYTTIWNLTLYHRVTVVTFQFYRQRVRVPFGGKWLVYSHPTGLFFLVWWKLIYLI